MQKIVLKPNPQKDEGLSLTRRVVSVLREFCSEIYIENTCLSLACEGVCGYEADCFPQNADAIVVIGGDGSMLHAASEALTHDIPLLGINMGRVGYLASIEPSEISALRALENGGFIEKKHMVLEVSRQTEDAETVFLGYALNDVVTDGMGHLADIRLYDGDSHLDYRADGLIAATPTGSTAYSFSAGGPVMDESMDAICVTPVCPRSFFSRSLLFSSDTELRIVNTGTRTAALDVSLDGRTHTPLHYGEALLVRRSEKQVRILVLKPRNLLEVLCTKMDMQHF